MHEAGLVERLISYPIIELPPSDNFEEKQPLLLATELRNAKTIVTVQFQPTPQIKKLAATGLSIGGQAHFTNASPSSLSEAHESESRLATISLLTPATNGGEFIFTSPKKELAFPGAHLYRVIEMPTNLNFVCRPRTIEANVEPPFDVVEQNPEDFLVGLQWDDGEGIALNSGEVSHVDSCNGSDRL